MQGQPAVRAAGRRGRRRGRDGLGARLPDAAGAGDAARAAARPADRLLPAHPVPAGGAVPAAALAPAAPRGPARRRRRRVPAAGCGPELRAAGPPAGRATRRTATRSTCPTAGSCRRRRSRSPSTPRSSTSWPGRESVEQRSQGDPRAARQPRDGPARHRPARLHQGHLRPAPRVRRADRRRGALRSRTPSSCRWPPRPASGSSSTASCATRSTGSSAASTATSARIGSPAIHYLHTSYPKEEMAALFRAADVMVVTPLRDGMNLVAKEYVACRYDDGGALVLSEFAGAADELRQAFMVNPYDINGMKEAIVTAVNAGPRSSRRRMKAMRKTVAEHDVKDWARRSSPCSARPSPRTTSTCGPPRSRETPRATRRPSRRLSASRITSRHGSDPQAGPGRLRGRERRPQGPLRRPRRPAPDAPHADRRGHAARGPPLPAARLATGSTATRCCW